jgi:hypothetical protein
VVPHGLDEQVLLELNVDLRSSRIGAEFVQRHTHRLVLIDRRGIPNDLVVTVFAVMPSDDGGPGYVFQPKASP